MANSTTSTYGIKETEAQIFAKKRNSAPNAYQQANFDKWNSAMNGETEKPSEFAAAMNELLEMTNEKITVMAAAKANDGFLRLRLEQISLAQNGDISAMDEVQKFSQGEANNLENSLGDERADAKYRDKATRELEIYQKAISAILAQKEKMANAESQEFSQESLVDSNEISDEDLANSQISAEEKAANINSARAEIDGIFNQTSQDSSANQNQISQTQNQEAKETKTDFEDVSEEDFTRELRALSLKFGEESDWNKYIKGNDYTSYKDSPKMRGNVFATLKKFNEQIAQKGKGDTTLDTFLQEMEKAHGLRK